MGYKFFSYVYYSEQFTPYYVGVGTGRRARDRHRTSVPIPPNERIMRFFWHTEDEAFDHEKEMIAEWGRGDIGTGILLNRTSGGPGCTNPGPEQLAAMSAVGKQVIAGCRAKENHVFANHIRWHVNRHRTNPSCEHCQGTNGI